MLARVGDDRGDMCCPSNKDRDALALKLLMVFVSVAAVAGTLMP
jgi:hypothetical protein